MNKLKKILTVEDLVAFCNKANLYTFNAKETGYQLAVQVPAVFEQAESNDSSLLYAFVRLFHTGLNRNHSCVTEEAAQNSLSGIKYKPILANFCEIDGEKDFTSHDMEFDNDGNVIYIEKQVGCFTADEPYMAIDEETGKNFVYAKIAIPREYTDAASIIERKNGTKISVELLVNEMQFDARTKELQLTDIEVQGATLLGKDPATGKDIQEGMKNAKVSLTDFSTENNSVFSHAEVNDKLVETLDKLNTTLSQCFNKENQKGGMESMKLEELLAKYSKTVEDLDFDYKDMTDEELEVKFAELFDVAEGTEDTSTDETGRSEEVDEVSAEEEKEEVAVETESEEEIAVEEVTEPEDAAEDTKNFSINMNGKTMSFELSLSDKIWALCDLVNATYAESDNTYYSVNAFESHVIMIDFWTGRAFKQSYIQEDSNFTLIGDRVEVFTNWLTAEEEAALSEMRTHYALIQDKLSAYEKAEIDAPKAQIFEAEEYAEFLDSEDFKALLENKDAYSVEELKDKAEIAFAKCVKAKGTFNVHKEGNKPQKHGLFSTKPTEKKKPYGNLFSE